MTKIVIGSTAARYHFPDWREPKDLDIFTDEDIPGDNFWHPALHRWFGHSEDRMATPNELYTIKASHMGWELKNGSWRKHAFDVYKFQQAGAQIEQPLYEILYEVWTEKHGPKRVNLNLEPKEFFNAHVYRPYDHDSLHDSVAFEPGVPLYTKILQDDHPVMVDRDKWNALPYQDQLNMVREEAYATALERFMIPSKYEYSARKAYDWSIQKTITSFSKGWWCDFAIANWQHFVRPNMDYVQHHLNNFHLVKRNELHEFEVPK